MTDPLKRFEARMRRGILIAPRYTLQFYGGWAHTSTGFWVGPPSSSAWHWVQPTETMMEPEREVQPLLSEWLKKYPARHPMETPLQPRTAQQTAEHIRRVTKPVDWPTDEPDID